MLDILSEFLDTGAIIPPCEREHGSLMCACGSGIYGTHPQQ